MVKVPFAARQHHPALRVVVLVRARHDAEVLARARGRRRSGRCSAGRSCRRRRPGAHDPALGVVVLRGARHHAEVLRRDLVRVHEAAVALLADRERVGADRRERASAGCRCSARAASPAEVLRRDLVRVHEPAGCSTGGSVTGRWRRGSRPSAGCRCSPPCASRSGSRCRRLVRVEEAAVAPLPDHEHRADLRQLPALRVVVLRRARDQPEVDSAISWASRNRFVLFWRMRKMPSGRTAGGR